MQQQQPLGSSMAMPGMGGGMQPPVSSPTNDFAGFQSAQPSSMAANNQAFFSPATGSTAGNSNFMAMQPQQAMGGWNAGPTPGPMGGVPSAPMDMFGNASQMGMGMAAQNQMGAGMAMGMPQNQMGMGQMGQMSMAPMGMAPMGMGGMPPAASSQQGAAGWGNFAGAPQGMPALPKSSAPPPYMGGLPGMPGAGAERAGGSNVDDLMSQAMGGLSNMSLEQRPAPSAQQRPMGMMQPGMR
jgi:hypothetical protein